MNEIKCRDEAELVEQIIKRDPYRDFAKNLGIKIDREERAWKLLLDNRGKYTEEILNNIFDIVDGAETKAKHFGSLLGTPNRNKIFESSLKDINKWIETLLFSDLDLDQKLQKCLVEMKIKGASKGLATLLLYLSDPQKYNVWVDATQKGLALTGRIAALKEKGWGGKYRKFNKAAIEFRDTYGFKPQEIDWILSYIRNVERRNKHFILRVESDTQPRTLSFWWVCQGDSYTEDRGYKFLYAPHKDKGGGTPFHWNNIKKIKKSDIIFNYANGFVRAVSVAEDLGYEFLDEEAEKWGKEGTRVDIEHFKIDKIPYSKLRDSKEAFLKALKGIRGPFNKNGEIKQGYLFEFNYNAAKIVRELYGKPFPEPIEKHFESKPLTNTWQEIKGDLVIENLENHFKIDRLYFEDKDRIENRTQTALKNGDNIILIGPPGTGKSKLAKTICEFYCGEDGYFMSTATSDWSTFETIGGYRPDSEGMLKFYPGLFLQCFQDENKEPTNKWLIIDEINRADIDKAFGSLFSALTGDDISLPFEASGELLRIIGRPTEETEIKDNFFIIPPDWRIIATMNTYDKASLYEMSYAFMRRFAFIPINVPSSLSLDLLKKYLEIWGLEVNDEICVGLSEIWASVNKRRKIGPAIIEDMYKYILATEPYDYSSAIIMYVLPQFEGLVEDDQIAFIKETVSLEFMNASKDLTHFASDFFGIDLAKL